MAAFGSRRGNLLDLQSLIGEGRENSHAQRFVIFDFRTRCVNGVEKRLREIEMREAVSTLLEMARDFFPLGIGKLLIEKRPQPPNDRLAFGATVIHRTSPLSTNSLSAQTGRGRNPRRLRTPSMIPEGVDARERVATERFPGEFRACLLFPRKKNLRRR